MAPPALLWFIPAPWPEPNSHVSRKTLWCSSSRSDAGCVALVQLLLAAATLPVLLVRGDAELVVCPEHTKK